MKIWSISQYATPGKYAYGTAHHYIAKELKKKNINVTIFSAAFNHYMYDGMVHKKLKKDEVVDGVNYVWLKSVYYMQTHSLKRVFNWLAFVFAFFVINKKPYGKPDIIILSSHSMLPVFCALWAKFRYKAKLIVEIRDIWPMTLIEISGTSKYHPLIVIIGFCERLAYKKANWLVSTLPNLSEHARDVLGHDNFRFTCIPQGLPLDLIESDLKLEAGFIEKYFNNDRFKVAYAGSIGPSNAMDTIADVIIDMDNKGLDLMFYLIGSGTEKPRIEDKLKDCKNVMFLPQVRREFVQEILSHCDLFYTSAINSDLYRFGVSPQKWMDYMYAGKPVVASYSGYPSLINEADCGVFVPAGDKEALYHAILSYSKMSKAEIKEIGERGKAFVVEKRSFNVLASQYIDIFEALLKEK